MKNSRFYPFERNRYFYGKLLTVRDFEAEQRYMNNKRRLLNRLLFGSGIICGMKVVAVDDKTISVETGVALDYSGREIVVASPVTQKLSMIEGFTNNEYAKNVYLCIAYDEQGKEPVHSVASTTAGTEEVNEYNRYQETFKLVVKEEDPDPSAIGYNDLVEDIRMVYQDDQVKIWQKAPRYVNPGEAFEIVLKVEKVLQSPKIDLEYQIISDYFHAVEGGKSLKVSFSEPDFNQKTVYETSHLLKVNGDISSGTGEISVKEDSLKLTIGDRQLGSVVDCVHSIKIIEGSVQDKILESYFSLPLEQYLENSAEQYIYLAKINLLHMGPTFIIEKVENAPFGEYIYNSSLLYKLGIFQQPGKEALVSARASATSLNPDEDPRVFVNYDRENKEFDFHVGIPRAEAPLETLSTGVTEIELERNPKVGKSYFSDEIEHGLGAGSVNIQLGLEENEEENASDISQFDEKIYLGSSEVFKKHPAESLAPPVRTGVVVYPKTGTFLIGINLKTGTKLTKLKVRWWAFKSPQSFEEE
ncbi:MAG: hypothetical protein FH756_18030 [Firmicutes bacterium]|nr:hypothetical protein [Bacillota bacterium]